MELLYPKPNYISKVWAGDTLSRIRGLHPEPGSPIGISREVCVYHGVENVIEGGSFDGWNLRALIDAHHDEVMGDDPESEMVRVAYMDAAQDLSIQVHPDERYARAVEHDREKSESWYILSAKPGATVVAGTTATSKDELRRAAETDSVCDLACELPVSEGDFIVIPAGTLHACGKNLLAIEVGSFGGITYRLCDYGRGRELHVDKAMDVLDLSSHPVVQHAPYVEVAEGGEAVVTPCMRHALFAADAVDVNGSWSATKGRQYHVVTAVKGDLDVVAEGVAYHLPYTRTLVVPACVGSYEVRGRGRALVSYRPL